MDHKRHEAFGAVLWVILLVYLILNYSMSPEKMIFIGIVSFIFTFIGSTLPDIDTTSSKAFKRMRFLTAVATFVVSFVMLSNNFGKDPTSILYLIGTCGLIAVVIVILIQQLLPRHRGPIHSVKTGAIYGVIVLVLSYVLVLNISLAILIAFFSFLSFCSHLALDRVMK